MPDCAGCRLPDSDIERFLAEDCPYGDLTTALLGHRGAARTHHLHHAARDRGLLHRGSGPAVREPGVHGRAAAADGRGRGRGSGAGGGLRAGRRAAHGVEGGAQHPGGGVRHRHAHPRARDATPARSPRTSRWWPRARSSPGTKGIATKAVYAGGGLPHRLGLSESVLVFAQHTAFLGRAGGALGAAARDQGAGQGEEDRRGGDRRGGRPAGGPRRRRHHPGGQAGAGGDGLAGEGGQGGGAAGGRGGRRRHQPGERQGLRGYRASTCW